MKKQEQQVLPISTTSPWIKKSNTMARAHSESLTVWGGRIIALIASKVKEEDIDFKTYKIPLTELLERGEWERSGRVYEEIIEVIKILGETVIRIPGKKEGNFRQYTVFAMCGYENGNIIAEFHPDLKPHFLKLEQGIYTSYKLKDFLSLSSAYTQKLFEILKSWSGTTKTTIKLSDLHATLNTSKTCQSNFKDFRVHILDKALYEITEHTTLKFEWLANKNGRAVTSIDFFFNENDIARIKKEKTQNKVAKQSQSSNKMFQAATICSRNKDYHCHKKDNKAGICKICEKMEMCNNSSKAPS